MDRNQTKLNIISVGVDCCGCGNCAHICPKSAIMMKVDTEGFLCPTVNNNCVDCGACLKICPQTKETHPIDGQKGYVAISNDSDVLQFASSGGVFGTIAKSFLLQVKTYICAASYTEGKVRHIITQGKDSLKKCQGSKYVQSELGDCFPKLKEILKDAENKVLFCGTPCQVAALYSYLKGYPQNLFTLDLICHGVPSPVFLEKDIKHYYRNTDSLDNLRFRWRNPNKKKSRSEFILSLEKNGVSKLYSSSYDPYFASFMRGESFRNSCYQCHYANLKRVGNITIGDCDSAKLYSNFHPGEGKSTVLINDEQGAALWNNVNSLFDYSELDIGKEAEANHQLSHPFLRPAAREDIYKDATKYSFWKMKKKYAAPVTKQQKVLALVQSYLPSLYKIILEKAM